MNNDSNLIKKYVDAEKQEEALEKLKNGIPVQYIIGNVDFYDSIIEVNESVLIPRFETELLVDKTIKYANRFFYKKLEIIDMGTGSGCIAISLKKNLDCNVTAIDISEEALKVAIKNAKNNNVEINFINKSMEEKPNGKYDLLISNPPYIDYDGYVEEKVKKYEPNIALFAKDNGLYFYKKILEYSKEIMNEKFIIAFEIGDNQKKLLSDYLFNNFSEYKYQFEKDLAGMDRYLFIFSE